MFKLVAVSDAACCPRPLPEQLTRLLSCQSPPDAVILRAKNLSAAEYETLAQQALRIFQDTPAQIFLHGHWRLAQRLGVTRLHLPLKNLLALPPYDRSCFSDIGVSVHSLEEARQAVQCGATRLVAGHVYATGCKPGLPPRGLDFLRQICRSSPVPVYAIGGVGLNAAQWQDLQACGAAGACIMSAYMQI
ncbi:MAG: thiamine phosphate synthase [Phascolarctobacterium sp.]|uniref:thiamine phosphate synthase n=1 Tax=Phascolarctobacterium sp. TaxID=2049039 RepID=UPI0026DB1CB9|nr:thiamine phosphate synthase [Phascolarctobacterium sp.]MDO4921410.1 thiamine phosphate synthase [Phascolarctobacterium sp.]